MKIFKLFLFSLISFCLLTNISFGQFSISSLSTEYTENFNTLTSAGTWTNGLTLTGWYAKTDATSSITSFGLNTGTTTTAALYSFGSTSATDRALGYVASNTYFGTAGVGKGYLGWRLKNNSGSTIIGMTVKWTGEQWRRENNAAAHTLKLFYQIGESVTDLTAGTWTDASSIFTTPITGATSGTSLDGNLAANRTADITQSFSVTIPAGSEIMLRWEDLNDANNDHQMAIDDVSFTALGTSSTPTITVNPASLTGFSYIHGSGPSGEQSFNISGTNLSGNISIVPPTNYEISTNTGVSFVATNPITLTQSGGTVNSTTIYVRLKSGLTAGSYNSENITASSTGATDKTVSCSGNVYKQEPTNHATDFSPSAGTPSYSSIVLTWLDAMGGTEPDYYLIIGSSVSYASIVAPIDGIAQSDGALVKNIARGLESVTLINLNVSTTYYFKIFPYTNSGTNINYKTDGVVPQAERTTTVAPPLIIEENFDYTAGTNLTDNGWSAHSGSGSNPITVNSGGLTYTGYPSSGIGNAALLDNTGEDVNRQFSPQTSGTLYFSFLVKVSAIFDGYFIHLAYDATDFAARVFIRNSSGNLQFGLSNTSTGNFAVSPTNFSINTTYLCIVKYNVSATGNCSLWVFSSGVPSDETAAGIPEVTTTGSGVNDIRRVSLRQYSASQNIVVDGIRIATTWADGPLPVALSSFNYIVTIRNVKLNWVTESEVNNAGFFVERLMNEFPQGTYGNDSYGEWQSSGFVEGQGTKNTSTSYSFEDKNLNTGKYKYRLKQIDHNGNFEYFELNREVEIGVPKKYDLSQNYPNPFNPATKIDFSLPLDSRVNIVLYDITGREVKTLVNDSRKAGYYTVQFNASELSSGTYFYRIMTKSSGQDFVMTKKMMLVK